MASSSSRLLNLSRRERQIMNIIYRLGSATAAEVHEQLPDPPSYSAVRALLRVLEEKGHLKHRQDGPRYVFSPTVSRSKARQSALRQIVQTFFDGSTENAVEALLDMDASKLSPDELERLEKMIRVARDDGR
ncbi:MAG: BlaI/MecI/CopY family transcriptional regulator [Planctomycetota bacterium]|jgi:predicted transcriptional regulator